jgi:hypothetical protein
VKIKKRITVIAAGVKLEKSGPSVDWIPKKPHLTATTL